MGNFFCRKAETAAVVKADYSNNFFEKTDSILKTTDLTDNQKILFKRRYMNKLHSFRNYKHIYAVWFYLHRFLATTLGVAIPALLSIQYYFGDGSMNNPVYWTAWGLSIFGGFVTGYNNIFKVDQRYFLLRTIYQKMKNEGWLFILLCGKYNITPDETNARHQRRHREVFVIFMESIEEIIENYNKNDMETVMAVDSKVKGDVVNDLLKGRSIEDGEQGKEMVISAVASGGGAVVAGIPEMRLNLPALN
jgi:hypothetical protein